MALLCSYLYLNSSFASTECFPDQYWVRCCKTEING